MNYITIVAPTYEDAVKSAREQYGDRIRIHSRKDVVEKGFLGIGRKRHCELTCFLADGEGPKTVKTEVHESKPAQRDSSEMIREKEDERDMKRFEREAYTPDPDSNTPDPALEPDEPVVLDDIPVEQTHEETPAPAPEPEPKVEKDPLEDLMKHARSVLSMNDFSEDYIRWIVSDLRKQLEPALPAVPSKNEFELLIVDRIVSSVDIDHNSQLHPPRIFALVGPTGRESTHIQVLTHCFQDGSTET